MNFQQESLKLIACPQCRGELKLTKEEVLLCIRCRVCFPVENGTPLLTLESALPLSMDGKMLPRQIQASFEIESGVNAGDVFTLEKDCCRVIGRKLDDNTQTLVFNADFTMSLDDHTKKMIMNYLNKKDPARKRAATTAPHELGSYRRLADVILNDPMVSRLHAMLFYDDSGVGVLDLVSRNGTFVNQKEVEAFSLKSGDIIGLGDTLIRLTVK